MDWLISLLICDRDIVLTHARVNLSLYLKSIKRGKPDGCSTRRSPALIQQDYHNIIYLISSSIVRSSPSHKFFATNLLSQLILLHKDVHIREQVFATYGQTPSTQLYWLPNSERHFFFLYSIYSIFCILLTCMTSLTLFFQLQTLLVSKQLGEQIKNKYKYIIQSWRFVS